MSQIDKVKELISCIWYSDLVMMIQMTLLAIALIFDTQTIMEITKFYFPSFVESELLEIFPSLIQVNDLTWKLIGLWVIRETLPWFFIMKNEKNSIISLDFSMQLGRLLWICFCIYLQVVHTFKFFL